MTGYSNLALVCRRWLGDETGALANKLVSGRGDVLSAEAGLALWELAAFAREHPPLADELTRSGGWEELHALLDVRATKGDADAERFLERWDAFMEAHGHHARGELDFATPRWDERPDYVLGIVNGYLETAPDPDPARLYEQRTEEARALARQCRARLRNPAKRRIFDSALAKGRESAVLRENVKSDGIRWIATIRRALLALGRRLAARGVIDRTGDVFFLEWEELEPARRGRAGFDVRYRIAERRSQHERDKALAPPPVVVGEWDAEEADWTVGRDVDTLSGLGVSAGVARGPARVLASHDADEPVRPGEILVAPFTDPGWTPYFIPAAGIVMDMGGMLSHGSIIAREYGIPAVVNVGPATSIIQTGQVLEVDGDNGTVRIVD
jgi:pyruvate,water dikinase